MYNTSQNYKNYIKEPSRMFESKIILGSRILDNDDVIQLKTELQQPSNGFTLGSCISKSLELTLNNDGGAYASVGIVNVTLGLKMGELIEYIPQGIFNIDKVEKTDYTVKVTAYDNMIKFETAYSEKYDNPTLKQVIQQLQDITGVEFDSSVTIPSYTLNKLSGYTCREILGYVASLMGGNAYITREGKLTIVTPVEVDYTVTSNNYWDYDLEDNTYKIGMLTCQNKLKNDAVDESDDYEAIEEKNTISAGSLGTDNMELTFVNPWMTETILNTVYNKLKSFSFLGYSMKWQGDLSLDVGNIINVIDKHGVTRKALIFSDKLNYNGGLTQESGAKGQTKSSNQFSTVDSPTELDRISVKVLLAEKAIIQKANITDLTAVSAKVGTLDASIATINTALINKANIDDLNATNANVTNLNAQYANLSNAIINKADIADLNATNANISNLKATVADISTLVSGNLTSANIHSLVLTADKVTVQNGFIKNAMVESLVADKITSGTLNTNKLNIASNDGGLVLANNTIQFSDKDKNVRVQIGQDAKGDFNFIVKGTDGRTVLLDSTGLHESAISDGLIKTDMIADNAINSNKIDYSSVISGLNADGSNYINASKVAIDLTGQTLDIAFNSVKSTADSANSKIDNLNLGCRNLALGTSTNKTVTVNSKQITIDPLYILSEDVRGKIITISFDITTTYDGTGYIKFHGDLWQTILTITHNSDTQHIVATIIAKNNPSNQIYYQTPSSSPVSGTVTISNLKLEMGNIPTDWTPAPEDVDSSISDIKTITETNTTSISAIQGQISTLISNTTVTVDGKEKTLKDAYSGTVQTVNSINTTIGEHTSTINTLNGTVSSNSSKITSIQSDLNGIKTSVSSVQSDLNSTKSQLSSLSTTLDGFESRVETTESNLNNLSVGGKNLLLNSDNGYLADLGIFDFLNVTYSITDDGWKRMLISNQLSNREIVQNKWVKISEIGYYTESIYVRTDGMITSASFSFFTSSGHDYAVATIKSCGNGVYRLYASKNINVLDKNIRVVDLARVTTINATYLDFKYPKFEKGSIPTDWTPAPEDVEAYTDTQIASAKSEIKQTTDSISQSVSNINSSITTINNTLGNKAEKSTVESISNSVSSLNTTLSGITGRVSTLETNTTTLTTTLNNLQVGGRNLLRGTRDFKIDSNRINGYGTTLYTITKDEKEDCYVAHYEATGNTSDIWGAFASSLISKDVIGTNKFTISMELKVDSASEWDRQYPFSLELYNSNKSRIGWTDIHISNLTTSSTLTNGTWITISFTYSLNNNYAWSSGASITDVKYVGITLRLTRNGSIYFKKCKLEKGTLQTDWTPAPEDVENEITTVQETVTSNTTEISALKNSISLKVDSTTLNSYKDIVNGQINTINSSISSMQSSIDLQLGSITSSVSQLKGDNLLKNSSFEQNYNGWGIRNNSTYFSLAIDSDNTFNESNSLRVGCTAVGGSNYNELAISLKQSLSVSTTYIISFYAKAKSEMTLYFRAGYGSYVTTKGITVGTEWKQYSTTITTSSSNADAYIYWYLGSIGTLYINSPRVTGNTIGTIITQSPTEVMTAFNGISQYFKVSESGAKFGNIATGDYTSMNDKGLIHHVGGSEYEYVYLTYTQYITAVLTNSSNWQYFTFEYQDNLKTLLNGRIPKQIIFSGADTSPDDTSSYFEVYCKTYVIVTEITANNFTVKIKGRSRLIAPSYTVSNNQIFLNFKTYYGGLFSADAIIIA